MSLVNYALSALAGLWSACALNIGVSLRMVRLKEVSVKIDKLPDYLEGLRILHISDIHNTSCTKMTLNIWKAVFKKDFDLAVITGDLTKSYFDQVLPLKKGFQELSRRVPTFFVDGNHEKIHFKEMKRFIERCGIFVLDDKKITLSVEGGTLEILGVRDYYYQEYSGFKHFKRLMEAEVRCGFRILLSHQPQIIDKLSYFKDIFVISGHTHGGQIRLPFLPTLFVPGRGILPKYGDGFYKVKDCYLYISRGIGASRIPIRFFNRPEIAVITLTKQ